MARTSTPRRGKAAPARKAATRATKGSRNPNRPAWRESVDQVLTAGKGAVDFVQRQGNEVLQEAQRRSSALTFKAREAAEQRLEAVAVKVVGAWDQVEQAASTRVGRTLNRLGVPSQKDIDKLTRSVAKLSEQIDQLATGVQKTKAAAKPKAAASKPRTAPRRAAASAAAGASA